MFCNVCGTQFVPGAAFCSKCGNNLQMGTSPVNPGPPPSYLPPPMPMMPPMIDVSAAQPRTSGMAVAGFVLSFLGMLSILGIIFSCIGLAECNRNPNVGGKGLAIAGLCISSLWILVFLGFASGVLRASHMF